MNPRKCKFCGRKMVRIEVDGKPNRTICRDCNIQIFADQDKQPRCPKCGAKAWRVERTDQGLFFVHNIQFINADDREVTGHLVPLSGFGEEK